MVIYLIVAIFIILDIVTGFLKAAYKKEINSTILREGLFHKLSEVFAIVVSVAMEYAAQYLDIGANLPIADVVMGYITLTEIISIIENLCYINPTLAKIFKPYLDKFKTKK